MLEINRTHLDDCLNVLKIIDENSIDSLVTDPPYGISYQNNEWDKILPNKDIWSETLRVLKPGAFGVVFSSVRLMHRLMIDIEDSGFIIKDVLFWSYLNGMPKNRNISLDIDKELNIESNIIGEYKYKQGYVKGGSDTYKVDSKLKKEANSELGKKYKGSGLGLKPAYEPIILIQKPIECDNLAQNIIKYSTGVLNLEECRIPYLKNEKKVGHNPHDLGRVPSNIIRIDEFEDDLDKFFLIPKVRQKADKFNNHPTIKPIELIEHLVNLTSFKNQTVLDPFAGSGTTGVACINTKRNYIMMEREKEYYDIINKRIEETLNKY
jgi:site-specific DNA-methyltransferase (adenine-specific)